ncbi:MAG: argininosuccinate synthase, partial [Cyclobacteriaceae bacterium]
MSKVVLAFSGGLDTTYCAIHLSKELGHEVHALTVNTGGFTDSEIVEIAERAKQLGVSSYRCIDLKETYYQQGIRFLIYGNVLKNNTYPLSVSAERIFQAQAIANFANEIKADAIAHGSTGAGNDQVRFDSIFHTLCPNMDILTPIREQSLTRQQEITYLESKGVKIESEKAVYSINQGLWGTSVGGKETLTSDQALPEHAYPSQLTRTEPVTIELGFVRGEFASIDGNKGSAIQLIEILSKLASQFAIGRDIHVGDTIIGIKGRVGFEAAAPLVLIKAHHLLEKHVLSKQQLFIKDQLSAWYGQLMHDGQLLDPAMRDIESFLESSQKRVTGTVKVK